MIMTTTGLQGRLLALPDNVRGALWIVVGCVCFVAMTTLAKAMGAHFHSFQVAFFRALFGFFAVVPFMIRIGPSVVRTRRLGLHIARSFGGAFAMLCGFYAITHLPLADAVSISYARALFLIPLAVVLLGEVVRVRRWTATAVGFIGVLVMMRPGGEIAPATFVALGGALIVAFVTITIKQLARTERPETMQLYSGTVASLVTLIPALFFWRMPDAEQLAILMAMGGCGAAGQYCMIRGFRVGETTALIPFDYTRLLFAGVIGYFVFLEVPDAWTLTGAAIIVASTLYIALREAKLGRRDAPDGAAAARDR